MNAAARLRGRARAADELLAEHYESLKGEIVNGVGGRLRAEGIRTVIVQDLEAAYNLGWHGLTQHVIQGKPVTSLPGLLYTITHRRALEIYRSKREGQHVDVDLEQRGVEIDVAGQLDDQAKLNRLLARMKDRLNDKERRAITLCVLHGYRRREAAELLGMERRAFDRLMDGASRKLAGIVASIEARGCGGEEWARLMRAYALGLLSEDDRDYPRAEQHIEGANACEACSRYVRGLRGLAAVLPPVLPPLAPGGHEAGALAALHKLLGGGHGSAGAATVAQNSAPIAVSAAGNGGAIAALGGTATKAAAVIVIAAVAAGAALTRHHRHHATSASISAQARPIAATSMSLEFARPTSGFAHRPMSRRSGRSAAPRRHTAYSAEFASGQHRSTHRSEPAPEFSFETPSASRPAPQAPASTGVPSSTGGESSEFGFEEAR